MTISESNDQFDNETYVSRINSRGSRVVYRKAPGSRTFAKVVMFVAAFHICATLAYLVGAPIGPARALLNSYMEPVFKQSWYVFAPDPTSSNNYLEVRAKKADGSTTPWFNITTCDVNSAVLHHPIPDRRYITTYQLTLHYQIQRDSLPPAAKNALHQNLHGADWQTTLSKRLTSNGASATRAKSFTKHDASMTNLISTVARARWGDVTDVQLRIRTVNTQPFAQRNSGIPLKTSTWLAGWTPAAPANPDIDGPAASLYAPKNGC